MAVLNLPQSLCDVTQVQVDYDSPNQLLEMTTYLTGLPDTDFYLLHNGKKFNPATYTEGIIHVIPRLLGGKGGFGSMLRAIGAQIEKTTNREACRDLSGRRLRDINEEKRLKNWLAQKQEREREAAERKRKKLERLLQEPKVEIKDEEYNQQRSMLTENISDSVELGLKQAVNNGTKRKAEEAPSTSKKPKKGLLFDMDLDIDSDAEISSCDSDDDEAPGSSGTSSNESKINSASSSKSKPDESSGSSNDVADDSESVPIAGCSSSSSAVMKY
ncbi:splicing regulator SDE2 [Planococcus citri]|uniref:splicing regulator SDE2 n=1 Tax=Planococcus citri TaxID=170843 RepID=UPI0031F75202